MRSILSSEISWPFPEFGRVCSPSAKATSVHRSGIILLKWEGFVETILPGGCSGVSHQCLWTPEEWAQRGWSHNIFSVVQSLNKSHWAQTETEEAPPDQQKAQCHCTSGRGRTGTCCTDGVESPPWWSSNITRGSDQPCLGSPAWVGVGSDEFREENLTFWGSRADFYKQECNSAMTDFPPDNSVQQCCDQQGKGHAAFGRTSPWLVVAPSCRFTGFIGMSSRISICCTNEFIMKLEICPSK